MTVITFDTLKYSKKLAQGGMTQKQAESQAEALAEVIENQLATSQDIRNLETKLETKMNTLETKMNAMESRILFRLGGLITLATAVLGILISVHH